MVHLRFRAGALVAGMLIALASQAQPSTQAPSVGAWRKVSDAQFNQQFHFAMLPGVAAINGEWAVYDSEAGRVVCCLIVQGPELTEAELEADYDIPGPWITDLTNGWNLDAAPYRPRVQLLRVEGELGSYEFTDNTDALGGLLVPANARVVASRTLEIDGQRYAVGRKDASLADDDGAVRTYSLQAVKGSEPLKVEVPFATY
ncbi:hypothetical protein D9M68_609060 [compost metagenome]